MLTRREAIVSAASLSLLGWPSVVRSAPAAPRLRSNANSAEGAKMLQTYAEGVKAMMAISEQLGRSWTFQWYIHSPPPVGDDFKAAALKAVYKDTKVPDYTLATQTWQTCQAHFDDTEQFFLPWHRMYVLCLENIIATLTNTTDFALPYWNYTDTSDASLPEQFRNPKDSLYKYLYRDNRNKPVNAGEPIASARSLNLNSMKSTQFEIFNSSLDRTLHGTVHVAVGDTTNMGSVPWAARDPIFWLHHCNIDRIWAGWNAAGRTNPTGDWLNQSYAFVDAGGKGLSMQVRDIVPGGKSMDYAYDKLPTIPTLVADNRSASQMQVLASSAAGGENRNLASAGPLSLDGSRQVVKLAPTGQGRSLAAANFGAADASVYLVLNDVSAATPPGTLTNIYIDLPPNPTEKDRDDHYAGTLNFFESVAMPGMRHGGRKVLFDISNLLSKEQTRRALAGGLSVTFETDGAPAAGSAPMIMGPIEVQRE